jgi:hypothetical protein
VYVAARGVATEPIRNDGSQPVHRPADGYCRRRK